MRYKAYCYLVEGLIPRRHESYPVGKPVPALFCGYCNGPLEITEQGRFVVHWEKAIPPPGVTKVRMEKIKAYEPGTARCTGCNAQYREKQQWVERYVKHTLCEQMFATRWYLMKRKTVTEEHCIWETEEVRPTHY